MDKYEYKVRSEEIAHLIDKGRYIEAVAIADTIDWRRVKSVTMLLKIAALYRVNRRNEDSREILLLALEHYPTNRSVVYSLCELSIESDDVVAAIEYYKQFAKLAPKDIGVYTLRYRILEAQEASLEERIAILEELKRRDYQEEWAYELAYLYHRVGLATKCVEECDDIILWFGEGAYVMKAMELKALHVPLTDLQQAKYDAMSGHAEDDYIEEEYVQDAYEEEDEDAYDSTYHPSGTARMGTLDLENAQDLADIEGGSEQYPEEAEWEGYDQEGYGESGYPQDGYPQEPYAENGYDAQSYPEEAYAGSGQEPYVQQGYTESLYVSGDYAQDGYVDDGYGNLSYVGDTCEDIGGTGEIDLEAADDGQAYQDAGAYTETYPFQDIRDDSFYREPSYPGTGSYGPDYPVQPSYPSYPPPTANSVDMSQYNTINLQKVVAESMKELFPDDDVFEEERPSIERSVHKDNRNSPDGGGISKEEPFREGPSLEGGYKEGVTKEEISKEEIFNEEMIKEEILSDDMLTGDTVAKDALTEDIISEDPIREYIFSEDIATGDLYQEDAVTEDVITEDVMTEDTFTEDIMADAQEDGIAQEDLSEDGTGAGSDEGNDLMDLVEDELLPEDIAGLNGDTIVYPGLFIKKSRLVGVHEPVLSAGASGVLPPVGSDAAAADMGQDISDTMPDDLSADMTGSMDETGFLSQEDDPYIEPESAVTDTFGPQEDMQGADPGQGAHAASGRIARMVTGVSSTAPGPDTGAISKVIVPGEDARFIKVEPDMDELRRTTEESFTEELGRLLNADENIYHTQELLDMELEDDPEPEPDEETEDAGTSVPAQAVAEPMRKQPTGTMDLNGVLEEWERMKQDKAKEHQEEIKKHVLSQTGKILANFDNSIKSGILGELDLEETADRTGGQPEAGLEEPEEMPVQDQEEDLGAAYGSDQDILGETAELELADEDSTDRITSDIFTDGSGTDDMITDDIEEGQAQDPKRAYLSELERVVAQELGGLTQDLPQMDTAQLSSDRRPVTDTGYPEMAQEEDSYTQELPVVEPAMEMEEQQVQERTGKLRQRERAASRDTASMKRHVRERDVRRQRALDPEDEESIVEMAKEDALKTQEIKMSTADLSSLSEKIVAATKREAKGARREELRDFSPEEQELFENFAVTKKIKKQIVYALDNMTLAAYTGNIIITGDAGLDTIRMAKNLIKEYHAIDDNFSGKAAKITGEKLDQRNLKDVFAKLDNGGIIIEKANGMSERKLYEMAALLNQENLGIIVIMEDTKKEIAKLLGKQAMIADYFNIRIDLMEMDINALVAYAKNYALALEYSIDELGTLALYTRIANMQSGNHVVTKDEVRDIVDEAIWRSKKSKLKNFVDVLFARRYDGEDMIVLKERDFM